jgi:hypothetical protein
MQPPLPIERLAHDLIQIIVLRFPSELGANPILAATIAAGAAARPAHGKTDAEHLLHDINDLKHGNSRGHNPHCW